jgi:glycyl-tRNA synthetase
MPEPKANELMEKIVSVCKRRGFIFQSSEIYGGINGFWDYGPLGSGAKTQRQGTVVARDDQAREDVVGLEATIIMHPRIWEASGHTSTFSDPMVDCLLTKKTLSRRSDRSQNGIAYHYTGAVGEDGSALSQPFSVLLAPGKPPEQARKTARQYYQQRGVKVKELQGETTETVEGSTRYNPENGSLLTPPRAFNLMFKTYVGPVESEDNVAYLRPENAQAIFAQFKKRPRCLPPESPLRHQPNRQGFSQRDQSAQFHLSLPGIRADGTGVLHQADEAVEALTGRVDQPGASHPGAPQPTWGWAIWHKYWVEERIRFYESIGLPRTTLEEYWQKARGTRPLRASHRRYPL